MPYIGNTPAEKYAAFDVQYFTTSATASYTLDHAVANELDIRLVINNVIQEPGSGKAYTASGTTLTLSAATAGTDTMYCVYTAKASQTVNPPAGSVGINELSATGTKDATTFLAGDNSFKTISGTTINNNADNRVITGSGTANTLEGEANLVFNGTNLGVGETSPLGKVHIKNGDTGGSVNSVGDELVIEKSGGAGGLTILTDNDETGYILWGDTDATASGQFYYDHSAGRFAILGGSDIKFGQHVLPNANNSYDLGSTSLVWRNIYTSDLNMSNENLDKGNEVDGTKGSWSIQEGEEDLFLLNRKNGKKYKFNLTEMK